MLSIKKTPEYYTDYARVNTNSSIRLTVSTFLASICLATFAVFLPNAIQISGFDLGAALVLSSETLLGVASVLFLIVATVMSIVLTRFGLFSHTMRKSLDEGMSISLEDYDMNTLTKAVDLYNHAVIVMYGGLLAVLVSLPLLGFHIHPVIGVAIVLTFIVLGIYFRKLIRSAVRNTRS